MTEQPLDPREQELAARLRAARPTELSDDFSDRLRQRWADAAEAGGPMPIRPWRWAPLAAALLVVGVLAWLLAGPAGAPGTPTLAWADVVRAVQRAPYFHVTAFIDDPRSADDETKMFRVDLFHQQPGRWRGQALNRVQFLSNGETVLFDAEEGRVDPKARGVQPIPENFVAAAEQGTVLEAMLKTIFGRNVPAGEPVRATGVARQPGIAIFDYANDPTQKWARIWVLEESGLPIKLKLHYPGSDELFLATFDYNDPPPARFFDPAYFEKQFQRGMRPYQMHQIGTAPIDGNKPTAANQIHEVRGGYKPGKLLSLTINEHHEVQVVVTDPDNHPAKVHPAFDEGYGDTLQDNWGNVYVRTGGESPVRLQPRRWFWTYAPVPPFQQGPGKQQFHLAYTIDFHVQHTTGSWREREVLDDLVLTDDWVAPEPGSFERPEPGTVRTLVSQYLSRSASLPRRLAYLNEWLAEQPDSLSAWLSKITLYEQHGREAEARQMWLDHALSLCLEDPFGDYRCYEKLREHLVSLAEAGDVSELRRIVSILEQRKQEKLTTGPKHERERFADDLQSEHSSIRHSGLLDAMQLPERLATLDDAPKPEVLEVKRTADGHVLLRIQYPSEGEQRAHDAFLQWDKLEFLPAGRWRWKLGKQVDDTRQKVIAVEGDAETLTLRFRPPLLPSRMSGLKGFGERVVEVPVALPAAKDTGVAEVWNRMVDDNPPWPEPRELSRYERLSDEATKLGEAGRHREAIDRLREIVHLPDAGFPGYMRDPANAHLNLMGMYRLNAKQRIVEPALAINDVATADAVLVEMAEALPAEPTWTDRNEMTYRLSLLRGRLEVIEHLLEQGQRDAARARLDAVLADRPDLQAVPESQSDERRDAANNVVSRSNWMPRRDVQRAWFEADALRWRLAGYADPWVEDVDAGLP